MSTPEFLQQHIWDNEMYTFWKQYICFQNIFSKDLKYVNDIADDNRLIIKILFKYIKPKEQFANILYT